MDSGWVEFCFADLMLTFGFNVGIILLEQLSLVPTGMLCDWFSSVILNVHDVFHFSH